MTDIENIELDDEWIKDIDKEEKIYKKFYTSNPNYVNIYITYLDCSNNIIHIKTLTCSLKDNVLSKTKLIYYISKYSKFHKKKYTCFDIVKYNIDIDSKAIDNYIDENESCNYLTNESKISDIHWKNSVEILHSVNSLYIFYKPVINQGNKKKKTRKMNIKLNKKTKKRY
jgi:hypothetical protein